MTVGVYYYPDKTKDFGFAGHSSGGYKYYKSKMTGGAPKAMESDHFFISKLLDAELNGANSYHASMYEFAGQFAAWDYDCANIKCPCFIYGGPKEEVGAAWSCFSPAEPGKSIRSTASLACIVWSVCNLCCEERRWFQNKNFHSIVRAVHDSHELKTLLQRAGSCQDENKNQHL